MRFLFSLSLLVSFAGCAAENLSDANCETAVAHVTSCGLAAEIVSCTPDNAAAILATDCATFEGDKARYNLTKGEYRVDSGDYGFETDITIVVTSANMARLGRSQALCYTENGSYRKSVSASVANGVRTFRLAETDVRRCYFDIDVPVQRASVGVSGATIYGL